MEFGVVEIRHPNNLHPSASRILEILHSIYRHHIVTQNNNTMTFKQAQEIESIRKELKRMVTV